MSLGEDAYRASGVDYDVLDGAKRTALRAVRSLLALPSARGSRVEEDSIGEPAQLIEVGGVLLATVLECLGTKSLIARDAERLGLDRWHSVGVDTVAAVLNDLACAGAVPLTFNAYLATGSSSFYEGGRHSSLVEGIRSACAAAGAAWVGGESPNLSGVLSPEAVDLAGSALGRVPEGRSPWSALRLEVGDEIVLVPSSGLHANGASLARAVARSLPAGWASLLPSGRTLAEGVLTPSRLYVDLVEALQSARAPVHYASHVTGHGLRKLMRPDRELTYRLERLAPVPEVLEFLAEKAALSPEVSYGTFNMGAGFALYVAGGHGEKVAAAAAALGHAAFVAGRVEDGPRQVVLEPLGVTYESGALGLR